MQRRQEHDQAQFYAKTRRMGHQPAHKHAARLDKMHVVGVDPGKRELVNCVDMDDAKGCSPVRYTLEKRKRDLRNRQNADEAQREKPKELHAPCAPTLAWAEVPPVWLAVFFGINQFHM